MPISRLSMEDELDQRLAKHKLKKVAVPSDGNCFFNAVAYQFEKKYPEISLSGFQLRDKCAEYLRDHDVITEGLEEWQDFLEDENPDEYLNRVCEDGEWADHIMIQALSSALCCTIAIITTTKDPEECEISIKPRELRAGRSVTLGHLSEFHYFGTDTIEGEEDFAVKGTEVRSLSQGSLVLKSALKPREKRKNTKKRVTMVSPDYFGNSENDDSEEEVYHDKEMKNLEKNMYKRKIQEDKDASSFYNMEQIFSEPPKDEDDDWPTSYPDEDMTQDEGKFLEGIQKITKVILLLFLFLAVFLGGLCGKATLLVLTNAYSQDYSERSCPKIDEEPYYNRYSAMLMLMVCLCFPEVLTFVYSLFKILTKSEYEFHMSSCIWGMIPEICNAIGSTFLVVKVIPNIDATLATLMYTLIVLVPSLMNVHSKYNSYYSELTNDLEAIFQIAGYALLCWQIYLHLDENEWDILVYTIISLFLISTRYWENFVAENFKICNTIDLSKIQDEMEANRLRNGLFYSVIRMCVIVICCFFIHFVINGNQSDVYMRGNSGISFINYRPSSTCQRINELLWNTVITHCFCAFGTFYFAKMASQTMLQVQSYTLPLLLVTPIMSTLTALYSMRGASNDISLTDYFIPLVKPGDAYNYIGWKTMYTSLNTEQYQIILILVVGLSLGLTSLTFLTTYLWIQKQEKSARTQALFVKPIYGGPFITEELMLNRRQYEKGYEDLMERLERLDTAKSSKKLKKRYSSKKKKIRRKTVANTGKAHPQVFLCATMWHETETEMTQLLTSIMRLDEDQKRRKEKKDDKDYYEFQVHIMFDDAMMVQDGNVGPNKFVYKLIELIPEAAKTINSDATIGAPLVYPTPYGGKYVFVLPCDNELHIHLKDKSKIRHRKRWSQCMYLYYILGFLPKTQKKLEKDRVYILALDGDVDFQPRALTLLLDRMKRNPDVGAACGRIHPVGTGPVVWFQKFEYAVGHWLQKTAEHVLGCVLCSPGCFSLFRGSALLKPNVMHRYTSKPSEAQHYIQWDQGEDRWLCTLLLKSGSRIEYCAASESFTYAPEEFKEFYNQRRRWGPSTMANVFDILINAKRTTKQNDYISWPYIAYQMGLMASSILGPSTVVLIIQGSFAYVFAMNSLGSLLLALIPVIIFIVLCYTTSQDFQIVVAGILTLVYALVMMAVLVGIIGQMTESLLNPNSIFMLAMIGIYAFTGIIHPTEMTCLLHGLLYYLCVPSAFILLMVYSLVNMNNVTWGTREVKGEEDSEASIRALKEVANKSSDKRGTKGKNIQLGPSSSTPSPSAGYYSCGLGSMCQCAMCISTDADSPKTKNGYQQLPTNDPTLMRNGHHEISGFELNKETKRKHSQAMGTFMGEIDEDKNPDYMEKILRHKPSIAYAREYVKNKAWIQDVATFKQSIKRRRDTERKMSRQHNSTSVTGVEYEEEKEEKFDEDRFEDEKNQKLYWILDGRLNGVINYLEDEEHKFWKKVIKLFLEPLDENEKEKKRIESDLVTLRNKMTGAYFLINGLWLVLTFSLTLVIDDVNITFTDGQGNEIVLQPLAFLFLIFFLVILLIQFVTMLVHRLSTFVHLMADTKISIKIKREKKEGNNSRNEGGNTNPSFQGLPITDEPGGSGMQNDGNFVLNRGATLSRNPDGENQPILEMNEITVKNIRENRSSYETTL